MPKIDFQGKPPITYKTAEVKLTGTKLKVEHHGHPCFQDPLEIDLVEAQDGHPVLLGQYFEKPECGSSGWTVVVVRSKKGKKVQKRRLYGAQFPTPTEGGYTPFQSSGVWGADE